MFLDFYGLRQQPFGVTPDPTYLYPSRTHSEALVSLSSGIREGRGFFGLVAQPGMGKTTLLYQLMEELRDKARIAYLFQTQCDIREFLQYLLAELSVDARGMGLVALHHKLNEALFAEMLEGKRFVLIVDEAQNLEDPVLETIRLLSNFETTHTKLLQIVLAGQPELSCKLEHPRLLQLRQRIAVMSHLERLSLEDTAGYIDHRLAVAGYAGDPLFSQEAIRVMAEGSQGIPRNINNLCFNALTLGAQRNLQWIPESLAREVAAKSGFMTAPPPPAPAVQTKNMESNLQAPAEKPVFQKKPTPLTYGEGSSFSFRESRWAFAAVSVMVLLVFLASARTIWKFAGPGLTRAAAMPKPTITTGAGSSGGVATEFGSANFDATPQQSNEGQILTVAAMPGQSLKDISLSYTGHYDPPLLAQIRALNPSLDPDHVAPGELLRLPLPNGTWKKSFDSSDAAPEPVPAAANSNQ